MEDREYGVTILGQTFQVTAPSDGIAKRKAARLYVRKNGPLKILGKPIPLGYLESIASIDKLDRKKPGRKPGYSPKEEVPA